MNEPTHLARGETMAQSVYTILRDFGIETGLAEKINNEIYKSVITPLNKEIAELNKDVEFQSKQREKAENAILRLKKPPKTFTGNFEADVGEVIKRNLSISLNSDGNVSAFWGEIEI